MAVSSEVERARYSKQLADYTLRQFTAARRMLDSDKLAAAKLPNLPNIDFANLSISSPQTPKCSHNNSRPIADGRQAIKA
ncbi:hypothetical protein K435DRAFT_778415 [Dendrothele bispora CBS 962.96]|uniref:Uncharacterized protein n=1 Tax=Dendrothele bispora (strain CBS 962.96) TaxID=1314807 RepID=A0A4S8M3L1_DENBC|nr:hypothetical protein K435DRAFT_778415 [Dendrothele bispora CBS 962.96]